MQRLFNNASLIIPPSQLPHLQPCMQDMYGNLSPNLPRVWKAWPTVRISSSSSFSAISKAWVCGKIKSQ